MSEEKHDASNSNEPAFGAVGRTIFGGLAVLFIGASITTSFNQPEIVKEEANAQSLERHNAQSVRISANTEGYTDGDRRLQAQIDELRDTVGADQTEIQRIDGRIDALDIRETERWDRNQADHARIESSAGNVVRFLTETEKHEELLDAINGRTRSN